MQYCMVRYEMPNKAVARVEVLKMELEPHAPVLACHEEAPSV